jgi:hypothetical protein
MRISPHGRGNTQTNIAQVATGKTLDPGYFHQQPYRLETDGYGSQPSLTYAPADDSERLAPATAKQFLLGSDTKQNASANELLVNVFIALQAKSMV